MSRQRIAIAAFIHVVRFSRCKTYAAAHVLRELCLALVCDRSVVGVRRIMDADGLQGYVRFDVLSAFDCFAETVVPTPPRIAAFRQEAREHYNEAARHIRCLQRLVEARAKDGTLPPRLRTGPAVGGFLGSIEFIPSTTISGRPPLMAPVRSGVSPTGNGERHIEVRAAKESGTVAESAYRAGEAVSLRGFTSRDVWLPPHCWLLVQKDESVDVDIRIRRHNGHGRATPIPVPAAAVTELVKGSLALLSVASALPFASWATNRPMTFGFLTPASFCVDSKSRIWLRGAVGMQLLAFSSSQGLCFDILRNSGDIHGPYVAGAAGSSIAVNEGLFYMAPELLATLLVPRDESYYSAADLPVDEDLSAEEVERVRVTDAAFMRRARFGAAWTPAVDMWSLGVIWVAYATAGTAAFRCVFGACYDALASAQSSDGRVAVVLDFVRRLRELGDELRSALTAAELTVIEGVMRNGVRTPETDTSERPVSRAASTEPSDKGSFDEQWPSDHVVSIVAQNLRDRLPRETLAMIADCLIWDPVERLRSPLARRQRIGFTCALQRYLAPPPIALCSVAACSHVHQDSSLVGALPACSECRPRGDPLVIATHKFKTAIERLAVSDAGTNATLDSRDALYSAEMMCLLEPEWLRLLVPAAAVGSLWPPTSLPQMTPSSPDSVAEIRLAVSESISRRFFDPAWFCSTTTINGCAPLHATVRTSFGFDAASSPRPPATQEHPHFSLVCKRSLLLPAAVFAHAMTARSEAVWISVARTQTDNGVPGAAAVPLVPSVLEQVFGDGGRRRINQAAVDAANAALPETDFEGSFTTRMGWGALPLTTEQQLAATLTAFARQSRGSSMINDTDSVLRERKLWVRAAVKYYNESYTIISIPTTARLETWAAVLGVPSHDVCVELCAQIDPFAVTACDRQIAVDIPRCHQYHPLLRTTEGHTKIAMAIKLWLELNPQWRYWQGVHDVCAPLLVLGWSDVPTVAVTLTRIVKELVPHFYASNAMRCRIAAFDALMRFHDPQVITHVCTVLGCNSDMFAVSWFLTLFAHVLPTEKIFLLWDQLFLAEDPEMFLLCFSVALVRQHRLHLLNSDFSQAVQTLFACGASCDVRTVVELTGPLIAASLPLPQPLRDLPQVPGPVWTLPIETLLRAHWERPSCGPFAHGVTLFVIGDLPRSEAPAIIGSCSLVLRGTQRSNTTTSPSSQVSSTKASLPPAAESGGEEWSVIERRGSECEVFSEPRWVLSDTALRRTIAEVRFMAPDPSALPSEVRRPLVVICPQLPRPTVSVDRSALHSMCTEFAMYLVEALDVPKISLIEDDPAVLYESILSAAPHLVVQ